MGKYVYLFNEGNKNIRNSLGKKGTTLAEMTNLNLPVPSGFTIIAEACEKCHQEGEIVREIVNQIFDALGKIEELTNKTLGNCETPLLLSINSDLNKQSVAFVGLNEEIAASLAKDEEKAKFIYDSYRKLITIFAVFVKGKDKKTFEEIVTKAKESKNSNFSAEDIYNVALETKREYRKLTGEKFPEDPKIQILEVIKAIYKKSSSIAINIQYMPYNNLSETTTGTVFSRDSVTGEDKLSGKFHELYKEAKNIDEMSKGLYSELNKYAKELENYYKDVQEIDFSIEDGKLYITQTKNAKTAALSTINTTVDMVDEKLLTKEEAIKKITTEDLIELTHYSFNKEALENKKPLTTAYPVSPGASTGEICIDAEEVINKSKRGIKTILIAQKILSKDIDVINYLEGIITIHDESNSKAVKLARKIGKSFISGCQDITIDKKNKIVKIKDKIYEVGNYISIDGTKGNIYEGIIEIEKPTLNEKFQRLLSWTKEFKKIKVKANAETVQDIKTAIKFGAEDIGLCRTENMLFEKNSYITKLIISEKIEDRKKILKEMLPIQTKKFEELFKIANGKTLTIKLLDPKLHEFLPKTEEEMTAIANSLKIEVKSLKNKIELLKETDSTKELRGCKLAVIHPEIAAMQAEAIFKASVNVNKQEIKVKPEIIIPLDKDIEELKRVKEIINKIGNVVLKGTNIKYKLGTTIEVPRDIILADKIAKEVDFIIFDTTILTQTTYGIYNVNPIINYKKDPFKIIDQDGVGKLMIVATSLAKKMNEKIKLGVYGRQVEDEESIKFFGKIGINYLSCPPYKVPTTLLTSAQAKLKKD